MISNKIFFVLVICNFRALNLYANEKNIVNKYRLVDYFDVTPEWKYTYFGPPLSPS